MNAMQAKTPIAKRAGIPITIHPMVREAPRLNLNRERDRIRARLAIHQRISQALAHHYGAAYTFEVMSLRAYDIVVSLSRSQLRKAYAGINSTHAGFGWWMQELVGIDIYPILP